MCSRNQESYEVKRENFLEFKLSILPPPYFLQLFYPGVLFSKVLYIYSIKFVL
jgi:hypothetical protein